MASKTRRIGLFDPEGWGLFGTAIYERLKVIWRRDGPGAEMNDGELQFRDGGGIHLLVLAVPIGPEGTALYTKMRAALIAAGQPDQVSEEIGIWLHLSE